MRALLVAVVVVGCSDPPGVTLEVVRRDPAITSVELFVGQECRDCPRGMAPPSLRLRETNIAIVNDPAPFVGEWQGHSALFRLTGTHAPSEYVPLLIAVGFNDAHEAIAVSTLHDKYIPVTASEHWKTFLEPATPIVDPEPADDIEHIAVWPASRPGPQCVMVQHGPYGSDAVVPRDDTDCDGLPPAIDCAPFLPNARNVAPNVAQANCVLGAAGTSGTINSAELCLLGGPACNETGTTVSSCEALDVDYCVTTGTCNTCVNIAGLDCISTTWNNDLTGSPLSKMGCTVPMTATGAECTPPVATDAQLDLSAFLGGGGATKCQDLQIANLALPIVFSDHVQIGNGTLTIKNTDDKCRAMIDWSGPLGHMPSKVVLIADISLDNHKHLVMPFIFNGVDCSRGMTCSSAPAAGDTMLLCNQVAKDSTTCGVSANGCPNNVTACGARCCSNGEACINGACVCGGGPHCVASDCIDVSGGAPMPGACGTVCCGQNGGTPGCP